jgi:hypothetical protein
MEGIIMKVSKRATVAIIAAAATAGFATPTANAATIDQGLYPQTGEIYIDPFAAKVLSSTPAGDLAGAGQDLVLSTAGPSTTVAVLGTIETRLNEDVRDAARYPNGSVRVQWKILDNGAVLSTAIINRR